MHEVEHKARVDDRAALVRRLADLGATASGVVVEEDRYLAHPVRDFAQTDEALRVRRVTSENDQAPTFRLTYKGPRATGPTRARVEHEVEVADDPGPIFEALGFAVAGRVRKVRESHRLDRATVTLDHVDGLGDYVEVELVVAAEDEVAAARRRVRDLVAALGVGAEEPRSYLEMVLARSTPAGDAPSSD